MYYALLEWDTQLRRDLGDLAGDRGRPVLRLGAQQVGLFGIVALAALLLGIQVADKRLEVVQPFGDLLILSLVDGANRRAEILIDHLPAADVVDDIGQARDDHEVTSSGSRAGDEARVFPGGEEV